MRLVCKHELVTMYVTILEFTPPILNNLVLGLVQQIELRYGAFKCLPTAISHPR